jgi:hypothetical protein
MALLSFFDAVEDAALRTLVGQVAKEPLHHVEPLGAGGSEVKLEPRVTLLPRLHLWMFVGCIVLTDQMHVLSLRIGRVEQSQKGHPLLVPMLLHAFACYAAFGGVHCSKQ